MNLFLHDRRVRVIHILFGLLCFCVVMQMFGMPVSLWDSIEEGDTFESSISEAFSLVSLPPIHNPNPPIGRVGEDYSLKWEIILACSLFHPPCPMQ